MHSVLFVLHNVTDCRMLYTVLSWYILFYTSLPACPKDCKVCITSLDTTTCSTCNDGFFKVSATGACLSKFVEHIFTHILPDIYKLIVKIWLCLWKLAIVFTFMEWIINCCLSLWLCFRMSNLRHKMQWWWQWKRKGDWMHERLRCVCWYRWNRSRYLRQSVSQ